MEIILLRHGEPKIKLKGIVNAQEFKQLIEEYAQAGIVYLPPEKFNKQFKSHYVVCSHLERSLQSAHFLNLKKINLIDDLFAESSLPHFDKSKIRLPIIVWLVSLRIMWLFGFSHNGESFVDAKMRAIAAANKLIVLARDHNKLILIGHGLMNRLIARQLKINKWHGPSSPGNKFWTFGVYKKP